MADIKNITIDGTTYDLKDDKARNDITDLKEDINSLAYAGYFNYSSFIQGRRTQANPNTVINSEYSCTTSRVIDAKYLDEIAITNNTNGQRFALASVGGVDSGWQTGDYTYTVKTDDIFIINIRNVDDTPISVSNVNLTIHVNDNASKISTNKSDITNITNLINSGDKVINTFIQGRRTSANQYRINDSNYWCTTELMKLKTGDVVNFTNNTNGDRFTLASVDGFDTGWLTTDTSIIIPTDSIYYVHVTKVAETPITPDTISLNVEILDKGSRIGKNEVTANKTAQIVYGADEISMQFELGLVTYTNTTWQYSDGDTMIRTPANRLAFLQKGTVISLTSYEDARFYVGWMKLDGTRTYSNGWKTSAYITEEDGYYSLLVSNLTPTTQSSVNDLANLVKIYVNGLAESLNIIRNNRTAGVNPHIFTEKFIAHRGNDNVHAPENTIPAFKYAINSGYKILEYDVRFTSDNVPVVIHDDTINRTGRNLDGTTISNTLYVENLTYAELLNYDFGIWFGPDFAGTKIPTVEEFLIFIKKYNCVGDTDLTTMGNALTDTQMGILIDLVTETGMLNNIMFTSNATIIKKLLENCPSALTWIANQNESTAATCAEIMKNARLAGVSLQYPYSTKATFEAAHNAGLMTKSFTPYTNTQINDALELTPDLMIVGSLGRNEIVIT